ncbi:uncharacterized protein FFMR_11708 [Fusarium fujikuroi]|nr:uncharacterized protein FFMR_11708 [Fusarium fujikuroi]
MKPSLLVFAPEGDTDILLRKPNPRSHQESLPGAVDSDATDEEMDEDEERDDQMEIQQPVLSGFKDVTLSIQSLDAEKPETIQRGRAACRTMLSRFVGALDACLSCLQGHAQWSIHRELS